MKNNTESFMKPLVLYEPAIVVSSKNRTHFTVGYLHNSIDLIADFYFKKIKMAWQSLKEQGSTSQV